jgi:hypothetical protein
MRTPAKNASAAMSEMVALSPKVKLTALGLDVGSALTHEEWREIGRHIGQAMRSAAFVVGDWLVYGEGRDAQRTFWPDTPVADEVSSSVYDEAVELTGMDRTTLHTYAHVARNIPRLLRNKALSWEHHKKIAKVKDEAGKVRWLKLAADKHRSGDPISTRRLARSIEAGRLLSVEELEDDDADEGIENVHPYVNRISAFWGRLLRDGWLDTATPEKRAALKRDLQPVVDIYRQL